jgi:simple sugar transport system ATP-binding protein
MDATGSAASAVIPAVEAVGVHKQFGSTQALRGVDVTLRRGQCLGLVGRNGAGKSTLVSILSGIYPADSGVVRFDGQAAPPPGAVGAWRARIATVFQHSMVVPGLTIAENVFLGAQPLFRQPAARQSQFQRAGRRRGGGIIDWRQMRERTRQIMSEWGFDIDAREPCANLTVEQRQIVEIARALAAGTRCLLLDEPTAALERGAVQRLFERIRQLAASGVAVLYISHHLEEVFEICQEVAVLRDGELVLTAPADGLSKEQLVSAMVGAALPAAGSVQNSRDAERKQDDSPAPHDTGNAVTGEQPPCLVIDRVTVASPRGNLAGISLDVRAGERVGLTGLLGAGVGTLGRVVAGAHPYESGRIVVDGTAVPSGRRDLALRAGVGYIPEDRHAEGFVPEFGVAENITMTITGRLARVFGFLRPGTAAAAAAPLARRLSIVSAGLGQPVAELSGGNQQKVTAARALASDPKLIVAITPTRGVDVASKSLLLAALADVTDRAGAALLLATDELDDLVICDRVVVLVRGEVFAEFTGPFTGPAFDREALIAATEGLISPTHHDTRHDAEHANYHDTPSHDTGPATRHDAEPASHDTKPDIS